MHARLRRRDQRGFRLLKLATLLLAAGLPVTVAASAPTGVAALMGGLIAVIGGAQQLFKFQESRINYRSVCENLRREQHLYLARAGHYADAPDGDILLAESVERIHGQETTQPRLAVGSAAVGTDLLTAGVHCPPAAGSSSWSPRTPRGPWPLPSPTRGRSGSGAVAR
ncbi:DUF4231 domain-containing protein [Streptomyces sp. NPDC002838]|uniref:DUF4231 domain-containing protein n=1 Tax=Streptomyces sp. NPDC002838 TaxID=3154436 RepID=UPI003328722D